MSLWSPKHEREDREREVYGIMHGPTLDFNQYDFLKTYKVSKYFTIIQVLNNFYDYFFNDLIDPLIIYALVSTLSGMILDQIKEHFCQITIL